MNGNLWLILSLVGALGIGGLIGSIVQSHLQKRAEVKRLEHDLKQKRYLCILILMLTKLNPDIGLRKVHAIRPDLKSTGDVEHELQTELLNGVIYASNRVLDTLAGFLKDPSQVSYVHVANAMRRDLWGGKARVTEEFLELAGFFPSLKSDFVRPVTRTRGIVHQGIEV